MDFRAALEAACADADTRTIHFTTAFGMEASTEACRRLTAPGLREIYGNLPGAAASPNRPTRGQVADRPTTSTQQVMSPSAKKRLKAKTKQAEKAKQEKEAAAAARLAANNARGGLLALDNAPNGKGGKKGKDKGKGKGKGKGKEPLPAGINHRTTDTDKPICYGFNRCEKCVQKPCTFEHVCWWCGGSHPGKAGENC
jgi:hypothetical protein